MSAADDRRIALYLSTPFCPQVCSHCKHGTLPAGDVWLRRSYLEALTREIESAAPDFGDCTVAAVRVGGGIAGHMFDEELGTLLRSLPRMFRMEPDAEVSLTVHPGMVSVETLRACRIGNVTRLSVEFETSSPAEWAALERFLDPSAMDTTSLVLGRSAREALVLDFTIAVGIPGQTSSSLRRSIDAAIDYGAAHITVNAIDVPADGTGEKVEEERAHLLGYATAYLTMRGFDQYLPARFAQPGAQSRFSELKAEGCDVLGFGLGARTRFAGARAVNTTDLSTYLACSNAPEKCIAELVPPAVAL